MNENEPAESPEERPLTPEEELRLRLRSIIGADRWVAGDYFAVAPVTIDEVSKLLKGYSGAVMVVGSGTSFSEEFDPGKETLIVLTNLLKDEIEVSDSDQVAVISAGWDVRTVNETLAQEGFQIRSLARFETGTVGGCLAKISSCPSLEDPNGWVQDLLGLVVALPSGEVITLGGRCIKDVAGYDLKHFFTGSRGAIGVILKAVFRRRPISDSDTIQTGDSERKPGVFDYKWRRVFDPFSRMKSGETG